MQHRYNLMQLRCNLNTLKMQLGCNLEATWMQLAFNFDATFGVEIEDKW